MINFNINPKVCIGASRLRFVICVLVLGALMATPSASVFTQSRSKPSSTSEAGAIPRNILLQIVRAEDERRWDGDLRRLLSDQKVSVRTRAALAAGRIGNESSVADLIVLLSGDRDRGVREMAAFALGEIESASGADALLATLKEAENLTLRARAIEALGKVAAALPKEQEARSRELGSVILEAVRLERSRRSAPNELTVLLGLTAVLRAKPANAGAVIGGFAHYNDPRIRADVANTLARLRLKDDNVYLRKLLTTDPDPVVRANAARVLGATEDKASYEALLNQALKDEDSRVRVSAIRALASLKVAPATVSLIERGSALVLAARDSKTGMSHQSVNNELLEIATALGRLRQNSDDSRTFKWLVELRPVTGPAPELEVALARISSNAYLRAVGSSAQESMLTDWRTASSIAQGLGEIAALPADSRENNETRANAEKVLRAMLDYRNSDITINTLVAVDSENAVPDVLRAFAAFKPADLGEVLRKYLKESDVIIRASAADLLGDLPLDSANIEALADALKVALQDKELNDAALSILDALAKQKNRNANLAMMPALNSTDHLIRRKAVASLKSTGAGDFSSRIGTVQTRNTAADYERAISRIGKTVRAIVSTSKGSFTIELLPEDAPLTVDNFVQLARRGYFNNITFHRVVPNFVVQGGDPRGDGNGGPGYSIRCEINQVPYDHGAVGMALSGKDTGGSQWFVTHARQPHLDGGYTVFGKVIAGMDVVDNIVRGDAIRSISVKETSRGVAGRRR